jgi:preprotein translocase subunit SecG
MLFLKIVAAIVAALWLCQSIVFVVGYRRHYRDT